MKMIRNFLAITFAIYLVSFTCRNNENKFSESITLVASTPGGEEIKTILGIDLKDSIDFIRWNILLDSSSGKFKVDLQYGISKPNTNGFISPKSKIIEGNFLVSSEIYLFKNPSLPNDLKIIKINEHLFHILGTDQKPLVGNGGWSYVLNNSSSGVQVSELKGVESDFKSFGKQDSVITFDGRTPCDQIPRDFNLNISSDCIKLKWRLKLRPHDYSGNTGTFSLNGTFNGHKEVTGTYRIDKNSQQHRLFLLHLAPSNNEKQMSFFIADKNVLYFLNSGMKLFVGDSNFSYALNRIAD